MTAKQRVVMAFVARGPDVLLVQRPTRAPTYPGRWTTVSGPILAGEAPDAAAARALAEELPAEVRFVAAGLAVDFTDTIRKKTVNFRIYPYLFELCDAQVALPIATARWVAPDDVVMAAAVGETVPELDEALARVWDPPEQLPPPYRAEARAIRVDRLSSTRELAARAALLVLGAAPPERVAALRPALARVVNAARAAARPGRDVAHELELAARAEARAVASVAAGAARIGAVGAVPLPSERVAAWAWDPSACADLAARAARRELDLVVVAAEAVLARGDIVARAGAGTVAAAAGAAGVPVVACADAWAAWADDAPPPLEPGLELVGREQVTRVVGAAN
jgi:ADP-ribose pyrophosphatase YjhB (NUDIX family)